MHGYILYICVCVQLNVYSPFDQDVTLPNVMGGADGRGRGGEGVHTVDLGIKATSVYLNK